LRKRGEVNDPIFLLKKQSGGGGHKLNKEKGGRMYLSFQKERTLQERDLL